MVEPQYLYSFRICADPAIVKVDCPTRAQAFWDNVLGRNDLHWMILKPSEWDKFKADMLKMGFDLLSPAAYVLAPVA